MRTSTCAASKRSAGLCRRRGCSLSRPERVKGEGYLAETAAEQNVLLQGCNTTRIYCRDGCPPARRMKPENRVRFASRDDARILDYRACKVCKPDYPPDGEAWRPANSRA